MNFKSLADDQTGSITSLIHKESYPEEVRGTDKIFAEIRLIKNNKVKKFLVYRLSPFGLELNYTHEDSFDLKQGDEVNLALIVGTQTSTFNGLVVSNFHKKNNTSLVAIRFYVTPEDESKVNTTDDRRKSKRWLCSQEFLPTGIAPNPVRYNDYIYFKVLDISSSGMLIKLSLRNKFLIKGMRFQATITLPTIGVIQETIVVQHARVGKDQNKDVLLVGLNFQSVSKKSIEMISKYVMHFAPDTTLEEIRTSGLTTEDFKKSISFKPVRTSEEYKEVLKLRYQAYLAAGKIENDCTYEDMSDEFDSRARIVIGIHKGKVIATGRLIFNEMDDLMEHEQFFAIDDRFPSKEDIIEVTRVCTHPDYRRGELLFSIFQYMASIALQSGRRWILSCVTEDLAHIYRKAGFQFKDFTFKHSQLNNKEHYIITANIIDGLSGNYQGPILWNLIWGELYHYMEQHEYITTPLARLRVKFYRLFKPLANLVMRRLRKPKTYKKYQKKNAKVISKRAA